MQSRSIFASRAASAPLPLPSRSVRSVRSVRTANPQRLPQPLRATPVAEFLVDQSAIIGQGIVYFTLFYTTTNWWYYRRTRKDAEAAAEAAAKAEEESSKNRKKK